MYEINWEKFNHISPLVTDNLYCINDADMMQTLA